MKIKLTILFFLFSFLFPESLFLSFAEYLELKSKYSWLNRDYYEYIYRNSEIYNLDKYLICAVIQHESRGRRYAKSSAGARGLMQIMKCHKPAHCRIRDLYRPALNIELGCRYLSFCSRGSILAESLRKYNAGHNSKRSRYNNWSYVNRIIADIEICSAR